VTDGAIRIGAIGPLARPGIPAAGAEIRDAMVMAVEDLSATARSAHRRVDLSFEDSAGDPGRAVAAVSRLIDSGVVAIAGEFHSMAARAVIDVVDRAGVPYVCSSATLDEITKRRLPHVFRVAPPQAHGWRIFADHLAGSGAAQVVLLIQQNVYWDSGAGVLAAAFASRGVHSARIAIEGPESASRAVAELTDIRRQADGPLVVLLLVGYPEPLGTILRTLRSHRLWPPAVVFGDPAGRAIFADWWDTAGPVAATMPFLAYLRPHALPVEGRSFEARFASRYGRAPTFVAFEAYDSILVLAAAVDAAGATERDAVTEALRAVRVQGTRGEVAFSTTREPVVHQQWRWPPVVVARSEAGPGAPFTTVWDPAQEGVSVVGGPI
jgi:ABC-type branched-subunit amino acid transport system substrate-binding protein